MLSLLWILRAVWKNAYFTFGVSEELGGVLLEEIPYFDSIGELFELNKQVGFVLLIGLKVVPADKIASL